MTLDNRDGNDKLRAMNTELVKFNGETEDMFFGQKPLCSDWNEALQNPAGIDLAKEIDAIKKYEPLTPGNPFEHDVWVHQQRLRIALRHNAGLLLLGDTCKVCGTNRADPVLERCLVCAEYFEQIGYFGSRGSCFFVRPLYDITSKSWGLLYYWSGCDDTFIVLAAVGWKTWHSAAEALYPAQLYEQWLLRKYNGVGNFWRIMDELVSLSQIMEMKKELPLSPEQFEQLLKQAIKTHMSQDHNVLDNTIESALREYGYKQNH